MTDGEVITMQRYVDLRCEAHRCEVNAQFDVVEAKLDAMNVAMKLYTDNMKDRLATMNEIRGTLDDAQTKMLTKSEYQIYHEQLAARTDALERDRDIAQGKATQGQVYFAWLIGVIGIILALIAEFR